MVSFSSINKIKILSCVILLASVACCNKNNVSCTLSSQDSISHCSTNNEGNSNQDSTSDNSMVSLETNDITRAWDLVLDSKLETIDNYDQNSTCVRYCFFTDPHLFLPNNSYYYDENKIEKWISFLNKGYILSKSQSIICGGDVLTNGDSKSQACYKLSTFYSRYKTCFDNAYLLVGNHDTNYQGDTYINNGNSDECTLSQETLNNLLFDGGKSYYWYETGPVRFYCFDSGIDSDWYSLTPYRLEQLHWFADELLRDPSTHRVLLLHIALVDNNTTLTVFMKSLGKITYAFNNREQIEIDNVLYDFSDSYGKIDFFQAGHSHLDVNDRECGGIPVFTTRSFSSPEIATMPTFDIVLMDLSNSLVRCVRIGDGEDRFFSI